MQLLIDIGLVFVYLCLFSLLATWTWRFWVASVQQQYLNDVKWVMLEIKLPRDINKSPVSMEMVLATLLQGGGIGNKYARFFKGKLPAYASLEIASLEGVIHFYVRVEPRFRALVEANFYAQYPGIEIVEADDYTQLIRYHHLSDTVSTWGLSFKTTKTWEPVNEKEGKKYQDPEKPKDKDAYLKMPADFLPIKTYVDYGLEKDPKEEYKIDPLVPLLETMGGLSQGEYMWYQVLVQDESVYSGKGKPEKFYVNPVSHEHVSLSDMASARKKQIRTSGYLIKGEKVYNEYGYVKTEKKEVGKDSDGKPIMEEKEVVYGFEEPKAQSKSETALTQDEKDELEAINKKMSKPIALCAVRLVYVTKKEKFNPQHIQTTLSFVKPFAGANKFGPKSLSNPYDYPWQDMGKKHSSWRAEEIFEAYVEREAFFPHIRGRDSLDRWEDRFFWPSSMKHRKIFRMIYEGIFHPFDHPHPEEVFALNLEEIATLWHLPGATAATPTLPRINSTKGVAPVNLPL